MRPWKKIVDHSTIEKIFTEHRWWFRYLTRKCIKKINYYITRWRWAWSFKFYMNPFIDNDNCAFPLRLICPDTRLLWPYNRHSLHKVFHQSTRFYDDLENSITNVYCLFSCEWINQYTSRLSNMQLVLMKFMIVGTIVALGGEFDRRNIRIK